MLISIGPKYIMSHIQSILYCTWSAVDNIDTCCICWGSMFAMTSFPNFQNSPTTFHWQKIPRRVHQESLDTLTLGWQITELRRLAACNTYLGGWDVGEDMDGASRKGVLTNYDSLIFAIYIYTYVFMCCAGVVMNRVCFSMEQYLDLCGISEFLEKMAAAPLLFGDSIWCVVLLLHKWSRNMLKLSSSCHWLCCFGVCEFPKKELIFEEMLI